MLPLRLTSFTQGCYFFSHDMDSSYITSILSDRRDKTDNVCSAPRFLLGAGLCWQWDGAAPSGDRERRIGAARNWEAFSKRNNFTARWQNQVIMSSVKGFSFVREKYQVITIIGMANSYKTSFKKMKNKDFDMNSLIKKKSGNSKNVNQPFISKQLITCYQ